MSDPPRRMPGLAAAEADLVRLRLSELHEKPIEGHFDLDHLQAIHAHLFQDFPEHRPGMVRDDTHDSWIKHRALEGQSATYLVHYAHDDIAGRINRTLDDFGGADTLKGCAPEDAAERLAALYGDLDHAHAFYEGNSRTLREFTRELAAAGGHNLDWTPTAIGAPERNALYIARDVAVLERAFPDLTVDRTAERALTTNDRSEYEASFVLTGLRQSMGEQSLTVIIGDGLDRGRTQDPHQTGYARDAGLSEAVTAGADARDKAELDELLAAAEEARAYEADHESENDLDHDFEL